MKLTLILIMFSLLIGCVGQIQLANKALEQSVNSDYPIAFRNLASYRGNVVCGEFQAEDRWGVKTAFRSFIFRDELIDMRPIKLDHKVFCTNDTAAVVSELLGIDTSEDPMPSEQKIREDFRILSAALESYYQDNAKYPKSQEGLAPLLASYAQHINASSLLSSGDLEKLPLDPWQRPYLYEGPVFAGVKATPLLSTLGADGVAGGKGENADIKDVYMKYLDHIAKM